MQWNSILNSARDWLKAETVAQTTGNRLTREQAEREAAQARRQAGDQVVTEATYRVLEEVLPEPLSQAVSASRPEARAAAEDARRRAELAGHPVARLSISIEAGDPGTGTFEVPCQIEWPEPDDEYPELEVTLEAADPLPVGRAGVTGVCVQVPDYHGPDRYDLAAYLRRPDAGWDPSEFCVRRDVDGGEGDLYWYPQDVGVVEVTDTGLSFDLPMQSAMDRARVRCTIAW